MDFVLYSEGFGLLWVESVKFGDVVGLVGLGGLKWVKFGVDWYLFVVDLSFYVVFVVVLDLLLSYVIGYVLIEVGAANEEIETPHLSGIELCWLVWE